MPVRVAFFKDAAEFPDDEAESGGDWDSADRMKSNMQIVWA
jgi:hypothetical protein